MGYATKGFFRPKTLKPLCPIKNPQKKLNSYKSRIHTKNSSARENQVSEYIGSGGVASYMKLGTVVEIRKNGAVGMISHSH